ncbi:hypothetical protein DASC09_025240 [Saccharomycopsis crataegensis]|uniref:Uncharacterized protein n=1 Tax=Saccharomycopsis crataegensis TaxID=43959 RepID=A0AAV5QKG3_9ASCO|nr:hypothetical protein DASC09_025240 [Saccharomycopsis crataegensis]
MGQNSVLSQFNSVQSANAAWSSSYNQETELYGLGTTDTDDSGVMLGSDWWTSITSTSTDHGDATANSITIHSTTESGSSTITYSGSAIKPQSSSSTGSSSSGSTITYSGSAIKPQSSSSTSSSSSGSTTASGMAAANSVQIVGVSALMAAVGLALL